MLITIPLYHILYQQAEPIGPTRPSSAMFAYPNLGAMGMGTLGGMSLQSTMQMHPSATLAPPVPLPRYESPWLTNIRSPY